MTQKFFAVAAVLSLSSGAWAQTYVVQTQPTSYAPIIGGTNITNFTLTPGGRFVTSPRDEGTAPVMIGFPFTYYGTAYTSVNVHTNGFVTFGAPCGSMCFVRRAFPATSAPFHNIIAPFWEDFDLGTTGQVVTKQSTGQLEIEWQNVRKFGGTSTAVGNFKLTLFQSGYFTISYGPRTGTGFSASTGFENVTGAQGAPLLGCGVACDTPSFPSDTQYIIGVPTGPDLITQAVTFTGVSSTATEITMTVNATFRNQGPQPATGFKWRAWISTDRTLQESFDQELTMTGSPINCAANSTCNDSLVGTAPVPGTGNYYVIVKADDGPAAIDEGPFGEGNNVGISAIYFAQGIDFVATSISGPANAGPGSSITVHVEYWNQGNGTPMGGTMGYRIYLSADSFFDGNDTQLYPTSGDATKAIVGLQTVSEDLTFTVPANTQGGNLRYLLRLDPLNRVFEGSEVNNVVVSSATVNMRQADLVTSQVQLIDPGTGAPTTQGFFGRPAVLRMRLANEGTADSGPFKVGIVISTDGSLSLLQDTLAIEVDVPAMAQGTNAIRDVPFTIPLNNRNNVPFTTGQYFIFALADSESIQTELSETNNNVPIGGTANPTPILIRTPTADLTVLRFDAPSVAGLGELVPVFRAFKNIGTAASGPAKYRYYLSVSPQISVSDTPVSFMVNGTPTDVGTVSLAENETSLATEFVLLPAGIVAGTYYLGAVIDSDQTVAELDELNNGVGSLPVLIAPSSLRICTPTLLDAVLGRPYAFQLTVCGEAAGMPTMWAVDETQGRLPDGLSLSPAGLLTGTPMVEATVGVTVTATNAGRTAAMRYAVRVLPTTNQVEITTTALPPIVNITSQMYETALGAAGGVKPYVWRQVPVPGELDPATSIGVRFTADGKLIGSPRANVMEKAYPVTFEVRDALGTTSRRSFNLRVVTPGALIFTVPSLPDGMIGSMYLAAFAVKNFDAAQLVMPVTYKVATGSLPEGLKMSQMGTSVLIEGNPTVAGTFGFSIEAEDGRGRTEAADYLIRIYPAARMTVTATGLLDTYRPGDVVEFNFGVADRTGVTYSLFSGRLPPTSTMNNEGRVTGMIDAEKSDGSYNFVVEARDPSGAVGYGAFSTLVKRVPVVGGGCSATGGVAGLWALLLAVPMLLRRRRVLTGLAAALVLAMPLTASAQAYTATEENRA
ncbi:MAG: hypothetical protein JNK82_40325, partial [Myxococcaceae bacterium]|nr:hypothetical protein [Myxococcaceae bacterium]